MIRLLLSYLGRYSNLARGFTDVDVTEIIFQERLAKRTYCMVFLVVIRSKTCVMKVPWDSQVHETNIFICDSTAYRRLTDAGICASGITPQFYGAIENIDPELGLPHLQAFVKDEYPPTVILLEYLPKMKELDWTNYNERRMQDFVDGLNTIHDALTFNGEPTERQKEWIVFEKELLAEMAEFMVSALLPAQQCLSLTSNLIGAL
ncbi:hypothetical protein ACJ72_03641 [Emergomyces africanus]|uniref:Protein kinase domain-containing protein n=1 Tax=Emergomyces africanus TaxID=1955775 RepID=A0A1B7NZ24_9EURO|nr:hypothetical protein ACJ72_03641 [Emergomyces africanus]